MRRLLKKLLSPEKEEFEPDNYIDIKDSENDSLRWLNKEELYESAEAVPENIIDYSLDRFVTDGEISLEHFTEALEQADEVWKTYRERDKHQPRNISEREAFAYGAGAAGPEFLTNSPRYSTEVENEVEDTREKVENELEELYDSFETRRLMDSLLGPEETAQAEKIIKE